MPKVEDTDIPPGFLDLFFQVFEWANNLTQSKLNKRWGPTSRSSRPQLLAISLMVKWKSIYNGLTLLQKSGWTAYWLTLPFGSHSGLNGWPGSGFSAFIYENAPRYRAGLPLLLDAPIGLGPELLSNTHFVFNSAGWDLLYGAWAPGYIDLYSYNSLDYDAAISQSIDSLENGIYRVGVQLSVPNGIDGEVSVPWSFPELFVWAAGITTSGSDLYLGAAGNGNGNTPTWYYEDVEYINDPTDNGFKVEVRGSPDQGNIRVHTVSLRKYT